jgi:putative transcriptional regulator
MIGYANKYIFDMNKITSIEDVNALIAAGVEESTTLEYKSDINTTSDKWKGEMSKDVSAMANANGGTIIYGVKEFDEEDKRHIPSHITPIDTTKVSKETIAQVISSNISPKIKGLEISCLVVDMTKPNEVIYIVDIPQSHTAHQNLKTKQYHKRYSTTINSMEDYEIRDIMNRNIHPDITLDFEFRQITKQELYWIQPTYNPLYGSPMPAQPQIVQRAILVLNCIPRNVGTVVAEHVHYFVKLPKNIVAAGQEFDIAEVKDGFVTMRRENLYCDILEGSTPTNIKYGFPRIVPILPGMTGVHKGIVLQPNANLNQDIEISWRLNADGASIKSGKIKLKDIPRK